MEEPADKRPRLAPLVRPRLANLREEALYVLLGSNSVLRGKIVLPPELVSQCLEAMKRFCRVGHFLLSVFLGPSITDVDLSRSAQVDDDTVALLVAECPLLARLNLSTCLRVTDVSVLSGVKDTLKFLNLRMCHRILSLSALELPELEELCVASLRDLVDLPIGMCKLEVLDLTECLSLQEEAGEWCAVLEVFAGRMCPMVNDALVLELAQRCCGTLRRVAFAVCDISDLALSTLLKSCARLDSVTLESISTDCLDGSVALLTDCPLRELCIINCPGVRSLQGLPKLEQLRLDQEIVLDSAISQRLSLLRVRGVHFEGPMALSPMLTELWCLDCKVASEEINVILRFCERLQVLDLSHSTQPFLDDSAFDKVNLRELRDVSLCGCELLTDRGVAELLSGSSECLLALRLRWCSISDALFEDRAFPKLQVLDVSHCRLLSSACATSWRETCPAMTHLSIAYCSGLALDSNVLDSCKHLSELNSDGVWVSNSVMSTYWRSLTLETLTLMGCELLTDAMLSSLIANFPNLANLDVSHCFKITADGLRNICLSNRNLFQLRINGIAPIVDSALKTFLTSIGKRLIFH